jgi:hypothetical protein
MKYFSAFQLILCSFFYSTPSICQQIKTNKISVYDDEFRASKSITLVQEIKPTEKNSGVWNVHFTFEKVKKGENKTLSMHVVITKNDLSLAIEKTAFLKANDKAFELQLSNFNSNYKIDNSVSSITLMAMDSTGRSTTTETLSSNRMMQDRIRITLTTEMIEAINRSLNPPLLCFYSGSIPVIIEWRGNNLSKLKEFLRL